MPSPTRPHWQLPPGMTRGLWDYIHSRPIADDYDAYFAYNRLFQFDEQVVIRALQGRGVGPGSVVADLGCGTGRILIALGRLGLRGLAVDLSEPMLAVVRAKAQLEKLPIQCIRANLVQLESVADESVDGAVSLFSTLGMIRGRANRQRALQHACRILRPGRPFVIHVHNFWFNLWDPGGPWWVLSSLVRSAAVPRDGAGGQVLRLPGSAPDVPSRLYEAGVLYCPQAGRFSPRASHSARPPPPSHASVALVCGTAESEWVDRRV